MYKSDKCKFNKKENTLKEGNSNEGINIYIQCIYPHITVLEFSDVQFPLNTLCKLMCHGHKYKRHHGFYHCKNK